MPRRLSLITVAALAVCVLAAPGAHAAHRCRDYIDFYRVVAYDGARCAMVVRVQRALYRKSFNAAPGSRQLVSVGGRAWRCVWHSEAGGTATRCRNLEGRGAFRARFSAG